MAAALQGGMIYPAQMAQPAPVKATSILPTAALSQTVPEEVIRKSLKRIALFELMFCHMEIIANNLPSKNILVPFSSH